MTWMREKRTMERRPLHCLKSLRPDVMILDLTMPRIDGFQTLAEIRKLELRPQIVILSMHADPGMIRQALQGGALGYVIKQSVADELIAAVRAAKNGSIYLSGNSGVIANNFLQKAQELA
jgi:DNA-binding NarL/FixJ family response regulator